MDKVNNIWCVYKHTNKINGKKYIGITSLKPEVRWRKGKAYNSNTHFSAAIQKYGWDNFEHEIVFSNLTKEDAELKEIELISLCKSTNQNYGYNIQNGGMAHGKFTEESKYKMSLSQKNKHKDGDNGRATRVKCENVIYDTIKQCAEHYQIKKDTMESWLRGDRCMPIKFYNMGLQYVDKENHIKVSQNKRRTKNNDKPEKVFCDGIVFNTLKECSDYYHKKYTTMYSWLRGYNSMPIYWVEKGLKYITN